MPHQPQLLGLPLDHVLTPSRGSAWARWLRIGVGVGFGLSAVFLILAAGGGRSPVATSYHVQIAKGDDGIVHVQLRLSGHDASNLRLGFSPNAVAETAPVSKFRVRRAVDAHGDELSVRRERGLWVLSRSKGEVTVDYDVHLHRQSDSQYSRQVLSRLDAEGGRLLGSDVFLFPVGRPVSEVDLDFQLPEGWALYHPFQTGEWSAAPPSVHALYDCAMAVGPYRSTRRQIRGIDVVLAVQGRYAFGDDDLMRVIGDLVDQQVARFGLPKRSRYVFVVNEHPDKSDPELLHYFGLHFDGSMIVLLDPRTDRKRLRREPASLCAHEFFHNWLGELVQQKSYEMNWFVEGVTTWYAYQSLIATRMLDSGSFADEVQERYQRIGARYSSSGRLSVASAGQQVLQDPQTTELLYSGGLFVSIALDEAIQRVSDGERGLEEVLEVLFDRARLDAQWILTREELESALFAVSGADFSAWLDDYAYGNGPVELPEFVTEAR